jgi:hypothetical protein
MSREVSLSAMSLELVLAIDMFVPLSCYSNLLLMTMLGGFLCEGKELWEIQ